MCEDRVWVRQFQHQKALIWNISFFAFPPSPLHIFPELQNPKLSLPCKQAQLPACNEVQPRPAACSSATNSQLLLPSESWSREDKLREKWTMGNSKQKKVVNASFICRWNEEAMLATRAPARGCFWTQQSFMSQVKTHSGTLLKSTQSDSWVKTKDYQAQE